MTDLPPDPNRNDVQTRDLRAALSTGDERARKDTRNIPPLAWIIILILIVLAVVAWKNYGGSMKTPTGGEAPTPATAEVSAVTPPPAALTEANPDARAAVSSTDALPEPAASQ